MKGLALTVAALWVGAVPLCVHAAGLTWNATPSMPEGIWRTTIASGTIARGDIVVVCPSEAATQLGLARGYLEPGSACPGGSAALLKPVAALPGDTVTVTADGVAINGTPIPHSAALPADEAGRALKSTASGAYAVMHNEIWVISGHDPRSFDSR